MHTDQAYPCACTAAERPVMEAHPLSDWEFKRFQALFFDIAGIFLSPAKKILVSGRLANRLKVHRLKSYGEYFRLIQNGDAPNELQTAIDLLTTHETCFFREPGHFHFLRQHILAERTEGPFCVWSAACSSGEEPYSIAMVLAEILGDKPWHVLGSDISTQMLEKAQGGHYSMERAKDIPKAYLARYCLKGICAQEGTFLIDHKIRSRVCFRQINLNDPIPKVGEFDLLFLRNVLIYFDTEKQHHIVMRLLPYLRPGGYFIVGHAESLNRLNAGLEIVMPTIYRKA